MTYWEHFKCAAWIGSKLALAAVAISIHLVLPFLFKKVASNTIKELYEFLDSRDALNIK